MKPGIEGGYRLHCINPECGAVHESPTAECPPSWRELPDGYACPREVVKLVWEPRDPASVIEDALEENSRQERLVGAVLARQQREEATRAAYEDLLRARAIRRQRLEEQAAANTENGKRLGDRAVQARLVRECAAQIQSGFKGLAISRKRAKEDTERLFPNLEVEMKDQIVRLLMGGGA